MNLAPTVTFAVYAIISVYWKNSTLDVGQAFTSLALISLLTEPFMLFTQILPRIIQGVSCFQRVQEYCNHGADNDESMCTTIKEECNMEMNRHQHTSSRGLQIQDGSFKWKKDGPIILQNVNFTIQPGTILALIGPVGSGKSTLLESILGETIAQRPTLSPRPSTSAAYCPQKPWLENKSIRDSIVGEYAFDDKWYGTVIGAVDLVSDIGSLLNGDKTMIGSKGIGMSGGQKQRIVSNSTLMHTQ